MITATLSAIVSFAMKALALLLSVAAFTLTTICKIALALFLIGSSLGFFWIVLVGFTILLAPVGGVRKHLDISYPDDTRPYNETTKERIQLEEFALTMALPRTYLPQLLRETAVEVGNFIHGTATMFANDMRDLSINTLNSLIKRARATRLGALLLPKAGEEATEG